MQSAYLCDIFHVKRKKIPSSCGFNLILKFLVIFKMATIVGDVTGLQQRHHPQNIPHLVLKEDQRLSTESQIVSKSCNISKTAGRVPSTPSPLLQRWGYEFACTS